MDVTRPCREAEGRVQTGLEKEEDRSQQLLSPWHCHRAAMHMHLTSTHTLAAICCALA
jgi:hypothetical protein